MSETLYKFGYKEASEQMAELDARIPTTVATRDELRALKRDNERYEDVIRRLLREHEETV